MIDFTLSCETVAADPGELSNMLRKFGQNSRIARMQKLRVYVDRNLVQPELGVHWMVRPLLDPSLATKCSLQTDPLELKPFDRILAEYNRTASGIFELSDLESCDVAIMPLHWDEVRGGYSWAARPDPGWPASTAPPCC